MSRPLRPREAMGVELFGFAGVGGGRGGLLPAHECELPRAPAIVDRLQGIPLCEHKFMQHRAATLNPHQQVPQQREFGDLALAVGANLSVLRPRTVGPHAFSPLEAAPPLLRR